MQMVPISYIRRILKSIKPNNFPNLLDEPESLVKLQPDGLGQVVGKPGLAAFVSKRVIAMA